MKQTNKQNCIWVSERKATKARKIGFVYCKKTKSEFWSIITKGACVKIWIIIFIKKKKMLLSCKVEKGKSKITLITFWLFEPNGLVDLLTKLLCWLLPHDVKHANLLLCCFWHSFTVAEVFLYYCSIRWQKENNLDNWSCVCKTIELNSFSRKRSALETIWLFCFYSCWPNK